VFVIEPDDAALGAVLGALVGDAAGAVLEFRGSIVPSDVIHALTFPGGGAWRVAPGQVTDDGELTMSLLHALVDAEERPVRYHAALRYAAWIDSDPFDVGSTTARSLGCLSDLGLRTTADLEERDRLLARANEAGIDVAMTEAARARCMPSMANGSLMRATPLGIWGAKRTNDEIIAAASADAALSHPNPACVETTVAYVLAIAALIRNPGDVGGAVAVARDYLNGGVSEAKGWLAEAERGGRVPYQPHDGFVRIAFTHAFRHLIAGTQYEPALRETLEGGGDTDTNACIVGGLLGARWGANAIPEEMRTAVLSCDTSKGAHPRPDELHPRHVPALVHALL
jgi:ADP-ribosylglycohydrolase